MFSKELTERCNKALKYRKEVLETGPHLTIKLDYPAVLRTGQKAVEVSLKLKSLFDKLLVKQLYFYRILPCRQSASEVAPCWLILPFLFLELFNCHR